MNEHYLSLRSSLSHAHRGAVLESSEYWRDGDEGDGIAAPTEQIFYTYTVFNDGTVTLRDIVVTDDKLGGTVCSETSVAPGKSVTCSDHAYTVSAS